MLHSLHPVLIMTVEDEAWKQAKQAFDSQELVDQHCSVCQGRYPCLDGLCFGHWYRRRISELKSHCMICTERDMAKRKKIDVDPKLVDKEFVDIEYKSAVSEHKSTVADLNHEMDREYGWAKGSIPDTLNCILRELVRARLERGVDYG